MSMQAAEWLPSGVTIAACCSAAHLAVTSAQHRLQRWQGLHSCRQMFLEVTARGHRSHLAELKFGLLLNLGPQLDRGRLQGTSLWLLSPEELHLSSLLELVIPLHLQLMAAR